MAPVLSGEACSQCGSGGGGSGLVCSDCALDDLSGVDLSGASDGDVLTLDGTTWVASAPSGGGGGWKDFAEVLVTGGNGATGNGSPSAVTNLAPVVLDADVGDLIEVTVLGIFFGPQTFYGLDLSGGAVPRSFNPIGWYYTSNVGGQGGWSWGPLKFLTVADDLAAGTLTMTLTGNGQGGSGTVLEGSRVQATNLGPVAA